MALTCAAGKSAARCRSLHTAACPPPTCHAQPASRHARPAVAAAGETAHGSFPHKALETMATVARRTELSMLKYHGTRRYGSDEAPPIEWIVPPRRRVSSVKDQGLSEMFAYHATTVSMLWSLSLLCCAAGC